jgi:hypothetical protein
MTDDESPLEDLVAHAESAKQQYNTAQQTLQEVKEELRDLADDLYDEGALTESELNEIHGCIDRGDYGEARERLEEARQTARLEFDDEEKDVFARRFEQSFQEHEATVEQVRNSLLRLLDGVDRDDLVAYLYGKHSSLRKTDIELTLEAFEQVEKQGLDARQMARILASYERDLRIEPTTEIIEAIQKEAGRDE